MAVRLWITSSGSSQIIEAYLPDLAMLLWMAGVDLILHDTMATGTCYRKWLQQLVNNGLRCEDICLVCTKKASTPRRVHVAAIPKSLEPSLSVVYLKP